MAKSMFAPARDFSDLWMETYKGTFGRFWETPAVGPAREKTEQAMKGFATFANFYAAWINSNVELQAVFMEAMRRTQEKLASTDITEIRPDSYKDVYKIWMDTYSETFEEFMKSSEFASNLGELMAESMEFQRFSREMLEENYLKPMNLPTKTEIDEANREVYSLKKAIKEANRRVNDLPTRADFDQSRADIGDTNAALRSVKKDVEAAKEKVAKLPAPTEMRALKRTVDAAKKKAADSPTKREIDRIKKDLDSLKQAVKDLNSEIKKLAKAK
jgi:predicted  nucleic acid-binding Zn-ribbon protein